MSPASKRLMAAAGVVLAGVVVYFAVRSGGGANDSTPVTSNPESAEGTDAAGDGPPPGENQDAADLAGALAATRARIADNAEKLDAGTLILVGWSTRHLHWPDVAVPQDETSFDRVQKDPDRQWGKRLCVTGSIVQISPVRTDSAHFFNGVLTAPGGRTFAFFAIGSAGALAEASRARLCGVVTAWTNHADSAGAGRTVTLVGMFDLPENHPDAPP
jgi:hypothetical protein